MAVEAIEIISQRVLRTPRIPPAVARDADLITELFQK